MAKPRRPSLFSQLGIDALPKDKRIELFQLVASSKARMITEREAYNGIVEVVVNEPSILEIHRRGPKRWHLKGMSYGTIEWELRNKLTMDLSENRRATLIPSIWKNVLLLDRDRKQALGDLYKRTEQDSASSTYLNNISDLIVVEDPKEYFKLVAPETFPDVEYLSDGSLAIIFGCACISYDRSPEFKRSLEDKITTATSRYMAENDLKEDRQIRLQAIYKDRINEIIDRIENREKYLPFGFFRYFSHVSGERDIGKSAVEAEVDSRAIAMLVEKYLDSVKERGYYPRSVYGYDAHADNLIIFKPGFLQSSGNHPREMAIQLVKEFQQAYDTARDLIPSTVAVNQ